MKLNELSSLKYIRRRQKINVMIIGKSLCIIADDVQDTLRYKINTYLNALYAGLNQQTNESGV